jgi:hypothetical protein
MKFIFLSLLVFVSTDVYSQQINYPTDKIYLNDSVTVYEGLITEQAPAKYVKIVRTKEKDTVQIQMQDIWKMLRIHPVQQVSTKVEPAKKKKVKNRFVFAELFGSGGLYSFNYDFRFDKTIISKWGLRAGVEYLPLNTYNYSGDKLTYSTVLFPFMVSYLIGKKNNFLELGLGAVYVFKWKSGKLKSEEYEYFIRYVGRRIPKSYGAFSIGYRHNPIRGKIMWGIGVTPLIGNSFIVPNIGIKIGYSIK